MSGFGKCAECGTYGWAGSHRCPPEWEVEIEGSGCTPLRVHAADDQEAAKVAAERYDVNDGDYPIVSRDGEELTAIVRREGVVARFHVSGVMTPVYRARPAQ